MVEALASADVIVIGPSNPVISIGPILALPGVRERIDAAGAPVVAVNPLVGGRSVKGPTEPFLAALGRPLSAAGVASLYPGLLDGDGSTTTISIRARGARRASLPDADEDAAGRAALARAGARFGRSLVRPDLRRRP